MKKFLMIFCLAAVTGTALAAREVKLLPKEQWAMSEDGQFAYAMQIAGDSITLQLELFSPQLKMQSQTAGLLAYIDLTGKKKEKYSVAFPVVKGFAENMTPGGFAPNGKRNGQRMQERMDRAPREDAGDRPTRGKNTPAVDFESLRIPATMTPVLIGDSYAAFFVDKDEQMLPEDDVTLSYTDGRMFYSLRLPLTKFGNKRNKKDVFSIAVAVRETTPPTPKNNGSGAPESGPGGGSGRGFGGPGSGMGGPGGGMGGRGGGMGGPREGMGRPNDNASSRNQQYKQWLSVTPSHK